MWVTILNYMTGDVICKEYTQEDLDKLDSDTPIEDFVAKEVGKVSDVHYMCTESLALQIKEKNSDEHHITKT